LEKLTDLQELHICGGHIRNMEFIKSLGHLKELYLYENTDIFDEQPKAEIVFLSDLNKLECIMIAHMDIDDIGFLSEIESLKWIGLVDTGINDIMPLKNLKNLEYLGIYGNHSEEVKNQAEQYFKNIDGLSIEVSEKIPVTL
ncbi:MAG: hypothetical protein K2M91_15680, partial [Lachnospiraceae bacterium]|nr:hypothetical protein [Lachnospiraceae bacterium]